MTASMTTIMTTPKTNRSNISCARDLTRASQTRRSRAYLAAVLSILLFGGGVAAAPLAASAGDATWRLAGTRRDGTTTTSGAPYSTTGVDSTHLEALVGAAVTGAAGTLHLEVDGPSDSNRIVYFVESLGTFATGYPLPTSE